MASNYGEKLMPRKLRNETRVQADPVGDLNRWRTTVSAILERIEEEIILLGEEMVATECEMEKMVAPVINITECITLTDDPSRTETDDECDTELKMELCVIENNSRLLRDQCQVAWDKLIRLEELYFKLLLEVANEEEAEEIDFSLLDLSTEPANTTFKRDDLKMQNNSRTYEAWFEHTKRMEYVAEMEIADSYAIRESIFACREKATTAVKAQQDRTENALRKRIFEIQTVRNDIHWQKMKMKDRMEKCISEIKAFEDSLRNKTDALKLAESRLEDSAKREGMELGKDESYGKLCSEVMQLRCIRETLRDIIDCVKTTYTSIEDHILKAQMMYPMD